MIGVIEMNELERKLKDIEGKIQEINPLFSEELLNLICEYSRVKSNYEFEKFIKENRNLGRINDEMLPNWD